MGLVSKVSATSSTNSYTKVTESSTIYTYSGSFSSTRQRYVKLSYSSGGSSLFTAIDSSGSYTDTYHNYSTRYYTSSNSSSTIANHSYTTYNYYTQSYIYTKTYSSSLRKKTAKYTSTKLNW